MCHFYSKLLTSCAINNVLVKDSSLRFITRTIGCASVFKSRKEAKFTTLGNLVLGIIRVSEYILVEH